MTHTEAIQSAAVERYLLDEMSEIERFEFEAHYFDCEECAEDLRAGGAIRAGVRDGLLRSAPPAPLPFRHNANRLAAPWRSRVALPWAAAAVLAVALGYQTWETRDVTGRPGPEVLSPITLRPESRGQVPVVPIQPGSSMLTLAMDVPGAGRDALLYELRAAASGALASGRIPAPQPGAPLLLAVPIWTITPAEHYILTVRRASDQQLLAEYRFAIAGQ